MLPRLLGRDRMSLDCDRIILGRLAVFGHGRFAAVCRRFFADRRVGSAGVDRRLATDRFGQTRCPACAAAPAASRNRPGVPPPSSAISPFFRWSMSCAAWSPRRLPHRLQDAGLGDPAEKLLDRWCPTGGDHVESTRLGEPIGMGHRAWACGCTDSWTALTDSETQWANKAPAGCRCRTPPARPRARRVPSASVAIHAWWRASTLAGQRACPRGPAPGHRSWRSSGRSPDKCLEP